MCASVSASSTTKAKGEGMTEQKGNERLRPHSADGIQEYDNPLPGWWVTLLYISIVFAAGYLVVYHLVGTGTSLEGAYKEAIQAEKAPKTPDGSAAAVPAQDLKTRVKDPAAIAAGKEIFTTNCSPCHGQLGEGIIGPNLTDEYWLHGGDVASIIKTVTLGVPDKGMISWQPILGDKKIEQAVAYILTLNGTHPPKAKAPQGELYKRD